MEKPAGRHQREEARAAKGTLRACILTREERPVGELIRFVASPDGMVTPDLARKLPGRGIWVTATEEAVRAAVERKAFQRALKADVKVDPKLPGLVGELLLKRVLGLLSMANKAGLVATGFTKCERALERGEPFALLHALEAGKDGVGKLDRRLAVMLESQGITGKAAERRVVRILTNAELSLAIGRPNVVHAALRAGGAGRALLAEAERLLRYRLGASFEAAAWRRCGTERNERDQRDRRQDTGCRPAEEDAVAEAHRGGGPGAAELQPRSVAERRRRKEEEAHHHRAGKRRRNGAGRQSRHGAGGAY